MSLAWRAKNRLLWATGIAIGAFFVSVTPITLNWLTSANVNDAETQPSNFGTDTMVRLEKSRTKSETLTSEDLVAASSIKLQRMNPPIPPPPSPKPLVPEPKQLAPTVLFTGSLVGTIQDSDPSYCFAFLKKQDNTVVLIRKGEKIEDSANSPVVDSISSREVKLVRGPESQVLEIGELQ
jgi:hypothetical protein